jgi:hypothetical protein
MRKSVTLSPKTGTFKRPEVLRHMPSMRTAKYYLIAAGLVLISLVTPNRVQAQTYIYTFTENGSPGYSLTTDPISLVTASTTLYDSSLSSSYPSDPAYVTLDYGSNGGIWFEDPAGTGGGEYGAFFTLADFESVGTYSNITGTLQVTEVSPTPELSSGVLMLTGTGLFGVMLVMRKRIAKGLPQAT